jgi:hypothetical protein
LHIKFWFWCYRSPPQYYWYCPVLAVELCHRHIGYKDLSLYLAFWQIQKYSNKP